ncbi:MAG TPA: O-antigen ligase family protein, partial [Usitatibacter sp.]|nr:O-antigen ligase family protein [Usitatibacter sp.]
MDWRLPSNSTLVPTAALVVVAAVYAAAIPAVLFGLPMLYSIPMILGTLFPLAVYLSSNARLFFLLGMIFTAPLGLSINFRGHPHMGGAFAVSIYFMDFFMVPLIGFIVRDFVKRRRDDFRFSNVSTWWLMLMLLGVSSIVVGPFRQQASFEVYRMFHLWVLFLVIVNECVRERHFHSVVMAMAANVALNLLVATLEYAFKRDVGLQALGEAGADSMVGADFGVYGTSGEVFRPSGLSGHTNLLAAYLAMTMPIFIGMLYADYNRYVKAALAVLLIWSGAILGLTLSRSGWASFGAALMLLMTGLFTLPSLRGRFKVLKMAMLAVMLAGGLAASGMILKRITQSDPGALDFRLEWVKIAWAMVQDKPIFGFGLNSFVYHLPDYAPYSTQRMYDLFGEMWPAVHNGYMLVWSEQGTVGFFIYLCLHASVLAYAIRNLAFRGLSSKIYMISLGGACGVVAIMVDGLSSFYLRVPAPARTFWMVLALIVAAYYWNV